MNIWPITEENRKKAISWLLNSPVDGSWEVVFRKRKDKRKTAQNNLAFLWYKDIGDHTGNCVETQHCICKLIHGVPILYRDDPDFADLFESTMNSVDYETQVRMMRYVPVTREFSVKQMTEYLNQIEHECQGLGIYLRHPEDVYYMALGK